MAAKRRSPPPFRSATPRRSPAFELQAHFHGGLAADLKRRLRAAPAKPRSAALQPGTRLIREWRGERHEVAVLPRGFEHRGTHYDSLSEIARAITGARWSGPRFFGTCEANG